MLKGAWIKWKFNEGQENNQENGNELNKRSKKAWEVAEMDDRKEWIYFYYLSLEEEKWNNGPELIFKTIIQQIV